MKKWYVQLSKEQRQFLKELKDRIESCAEEYGLTFETAREKYSQLMIIGRFDDMEDFEKQLRDSLEEARTLAGKRMRSKVWIPIYNGISTQGILARRSLTTGKDKVYLTDCDSVLLRMRWHDILILSAVYAVLDKPQGILVKPVVKVTPQAVWNLLMPAVQYNEDFRDILIDTVSKFRSLSGDVELLEEDRARNHIISESYYLDSGTDDEGAMHLSLMQEYKNLCEKSGRIVRIDQHDISMSRTMEEQALRTYVMWRMSTSNRKDSRMEKAIKLETMQSHTGLDLSENWRLLKSVCRSLKVNLNAGRIWWE